MPNPTDAAVALDPLTKLAACPFCGGKSHIGRESDLDGFGTFYFVQCDKCRARSGQKYVSTGNDCPLFYAEVRDEWNRRAQAPAAGALRDAERWRVWRELGKHEAADIAWLNAGEDRDAALDAMQQGGGVGSYRAAGETIAVMWRGRIIGWLYRASDGFLRYQRNNPA